MTIYNTKQEAFEAAIAAISNLGIRWYQGAGACCYGCTNLEKLAGIPAGATYLTNIITEQHGEEPQWAWVNGGDTLELTVEFYEDDDEDDDYDTETSEVTSLNIHHGGNLALIKQAADIFTAHGFTVEWDGTDRQTITLNI